MNKSEKFIHIVIILLCATLCVAVVVSAASGLTIQINVSQPGSSAVTTTNTTVIPETTSVQSTAPTETQSEVTTQPQNENQVTTQAQNNDTTAPADTTAAQQEGMSIAEIVNLYNKSVNKVKSEASKITRNYNHLSIPEETLELPSAIQGLGKTAISTFVKPDDNVQEWTTADDFKLGFPVGGEDYSSHMTADMVESATCKDNGNTYEIEIILKDDAITNPKKGEGYAGVFNTTSASTFDEISVPTVTFNDVKINGIDGSIKCTVDKASERVTAITFSNTDIMYLNVKVAFSSLEAKMNMVQESDFIIEY